MPASTNKKQIVRKKPRRRRNMVNRSASKPVNGTAATPSRQQPSAGPSVSGMAAEQPKVHCTLAPMPEEFLLLPTNVISEVVEFTEPAPVSSAPQWFLGQIEWENRQVPVFSYAALISGKEPAAITARARIMIVKSLSDSARLPYLGILISDIPKLVTVQLDQLTHTGDQRKSLGVFCHVELEEQPAVIPDLDRLTHLVTHAAFGILPITQAPS